MTAKRAPRHTAKLTRDELEDLVTSLRTENRRLRKIVADRASRRQKAWESGVPAWWDGRPLRAARLEAGWTTKQLAAAIGLPGCRVSFWEGGRSRIAPERAAEIDAVFVAAGLEPVSWVKP